MYTLICTDKILGYHRDIFIADQDNSPDSSVSVTFPSLCIVEELTSHSGFDSQGVKADSYHLFYVVPKARICLGFHLLVI